MSTTATAPRRRLSKRQRQQLFRGSLYAIFVIGVVLLAFVADWAKIARAFLNPAIAADMWPLILTRAAKNTVIYTVVAFAIGLVGGLVLAFMRLSPVAPFRWLSTVYVEFFRGLPAILTISLFGFGVPIAFGWQWPGGNLWGGVAGLGAVAAAYMAETIRAGIQAVPKGQVEAARSLGMTPSRAMMSIVLPQAFRIIIPPLTNEAVLLIKDTSLLFVIGFSIQTKELFTYGRDVASDLFNSTPLIVAGIGYLVVTLPLTRVVAALERRQSAAK